MLRTNIESLSEIPVGTAEGGIQIHKHVIMIQGRMWYMHHQSILLLFPTGSHILIRYQTNRNLKAIRFCF